MSNANVDVGQREHSNASLSNQVGVIQEQDESNVSSGMGLSIACDRAFEFCKPALVIVCSVAFFRQALQLLVL
jgi:hypothetical protein